MSIDSSKLIELKEKFCERTVSINQTVCLLTTVVIWGYSCEGGASFLSRLAVLEAIRAQSNIGLERSFLPFHKNDVLSSISDVHVSGIEEPNDVNPFVSWFSDGSEMRAEND